jgi:3-phosphoglycerate kinase
MATKQAPTTGATEAEAEIKLREALATMKAASDRHAAIVAVMSRLGVSPQERRHAQSESKKVDRQLSDAKRLLREAEAAARTTKGRIAH